MTDPFPDGNVMIGDLILDHHWTHDLVKRFTNTSHPIEPPVHFQNSEMTHHKKKIAGLAADEFQNNEMTHHIFWSTLSGGYVR